MSKANKICILSGCVSGLMCFLAIMVFGNIIGTAIGLFLMLPISIGFGLWASEYD